MSAMPPWLLVFIAAAIATFTGIHYQKPWFLGVAWLLVFLGLVLAVALSDGSTRGDLD